MYGCILGDIIGSRFEFSKLRKNKSKEFELLHEDCYFTDDTIMTIATIDTLLNQKDFAKTYKEWVRKYSDSKYSYGTHFYDWAISEDYKPYNSFGNGSAMRAGCIGMCFDNLDDVMMNAEKSASVTHSHIEGVKGASATACAVYLAKNKTPKKNIKEIIELYFDYNLSRTLNEIRPKYNFDVSCQGSVPESIICFLESDSFEDAIRNAISLGGDTDTMACITGGIAEAYYGVPEYLIEYTINKLPLEMRFLLTNFYNESKLPF